MCTRIRALDYHTTLTHVRRCATHVTVVYDPLPHCARVLGYVRAHTVKVSARLVGFGGLALLIGEEGREGEDGKGEGEKGEGGEGKGEGEVEKGEGG